MLHLLKHPTIRERIYILQAKALLRSNSLSDEALRTPVSGRLSYYFIVLFLVLNY
ncbi:uncharacterized protein BX663DRAFT_516672 [Cokeromyces recurvatus]|uniref:uncharacterized protein n=1 Tax=Cokeromyces recurvatus TaxID=90255 RepID=UPI002220D791|nr:uncharacterized protein BX663DRAFT_516672 [Cokeromyces recurvatus]KAI7900835.1 hypothetical protein BX663DRAFT_516672 [Cokeromyces recurvatus]